MLKALFATGLFDDVTMRREGNTLVVNVVENPIINRIAFEGNKRIEDADLEREIQLRPRVVYTRTRVQNDVSGSWSSIGATAALPPTVEPKIIQLDQNRVDLVFEIDEGARHRRPEDQFRRQREVQRQQAAGRDPDPRVRAGTAS